MPTKKTATPTLTLGTLVDNLFELRVKKGVLQAQIKTLEEEETSAEQAVLDALNGQGLSSARGERALVSISTSKVPQVADWEAFTAFVLRRKALHLLQRRLAVNAVREFSEDKLGGKSLPGCVEFDKTTLNVRKV